MSSGGPTTIIYQDNSHQEMCKLFAETVDYAAYIKKNGCHFGHFSCCNNVNTTMFTEFALHVCGESDACGQEMDAYIVMVAAVVVGIACLLGIACLVSAHIEQARKRRQRLW